MKRFFVRHWKKLAAALAVLLALGLVTALSGAPVGDVAAVMGGYELQPVRSVERSDHLVALSLLLRRGDGVSEKLLEILERFDGKATFFASVEWMQLNSDGIRRINEMGHDFSCLGETAPYGAPQEGEQHKSLEELQQFNEIYYSLTGKRSALYRPDAGYDNEMMEALYETGITPVEQSVDTGDWKKQGNSAIIKKTGERLFAGSILLCHVEEKELERYFVPILKNGQKAGLRFVGVGAILSCDDCYVDFKGTLRPRG